MLIDFSVIVYSVFKKYMDPQSYIHGDKDGIHVYDLNIPAEEIWTKMNKKEQSLLTKYGWIIDDGEFILKNN